MANQKPARPPVKIAILVGVTDYGHPDSNLPFCKRDVQELAAVLRHKGYMCVERVDQPLRDLVDKGVLEHQIKTATHEDDDVLFYFSGHGLDVGGEQLLQGKGVRVSDLQKALNQDDVLLLSHVMECLAKQPARKILIVDACRIVSNNFDLNVDMQKQRRTALQAVQNCAVVFASVDGKESFGNPTNNGSRFTMALVEELKQHGRGLLGIVEAATTRVNRVNDGKQQTPWIYASMRDRPMDAFRVSRTPWRGSKSPKYLAKRPGGQAWAVLPGSNALAEMTGGKFASVVRLPQFLHERIRSYEPSNDGLSHLFVKSKSCSLHVLTVARAKRWQDAVPTAKRIGATSLNEVFGAFWSPNDERIVAYGVAKQGKRSVQIWRFKADCAAISEVIVDAPELLECNSACWISDEELLISCSSGSDRPANVFGLTMQPGGSWRCQLQWTTKHPLRISAMLVLDDKRIALGGDDGSVAVADLKENKQPVFTRRDHGFSGRHHLPLLPWTGNSRSDIPLVELGVVGLASDPGTGLLGCAYFDSTISFYDHNLKTYVKTYSLPRGGHLPRIRSVAPRTFMSVAGVDVDEFEVESI
jgi:hypothetical protein